MVRIQGSTDLGGVVPAALVNDYHHVDAIVDANTFQVVLFWNPTPVGGPGSSAVPNPAIGLAAASGLGGSAVTISRLYFDENKLRDWIGENYFHGWHSSGSCRMGKPDDPLAVVDETASVYNVRGLKVVDASILPSKPDANIQQIVYSYAKRVTEINAQHLQTLHDHPCGTD